MSASNPSKTVLLVEDDDTFRSAIKMFLTKQGFTVTDSPDGKDARSILALSSFDLILSDVRMPHVFGTELLQYVRKTSQVPFVLMTGFSDIVEMKEAHALGASGFIAKPFKPNELLELLNSFLAPANTPNAQEEKNAEEDFVCVDLEDFLGSKVLRVDLYVKPQLEKIHSHRSQRNPGSF